MIVTREGQVPEGEAWWVGKELECRTCKGRVRLQPGDDSAYLDQRTLKQVPAFLKVLSPPDGKQVVYADCPTPHCGGKIGLERIWD